MKKQPANKKLTVNQEKFAQEFILTGNASEAYRRAYPKSLSWKEVAMQVAGSKMMAKGIVSVRIEELRAEVKSRFDISAERLLLEQARIALFDFNRLFDENGRLFSPGNMPDEVAAAVSSVKISRVNRDDDIREDIVELKLWNKNTALDSLFKNKGLYEVDNKQKKTDLADLIAELQGRGLSL